MIDRDVTLEEIELLNAMASDAASDQNVTKRARAVITFLETEQLSDAVRVSGLSPGTVRKYLSIFNERGWPGLLSIRSPRGGDFLARYDQGFWAERLVRLLLDKSLQYRAIPYGTSRSEPFTDFESFREYAINEFLLQAWSSGQRWKRPDLITLSRDFLIREAGNDRWTPDLIHWDNARCSRFVEEATCAVEVETSLWQLSRATVRLSFTVKQEDLEALRNWDHANVAPLYIVQVFYDMAYALPFSKLETLISPQAPEGKRVLAEIDRITRKATYKIPLDEGVVLGTIPEPDVEGRVYKAPNGKVTVYGRLTGSSIQTTDGNIVEALASGELA